MQLKRRLEELELKVEAFQSVNLGLLALLYDSADAQGDKEILKKLSAWHKQMLANTDPGSDLQNFCLAFLLERLAQADGAHEISH